MIRPPRKFETARVVAAFCLLGPLPAAIALCVLVLSGEMYRVGSHVTNSWPIIVGWLVTIFVTYVAGVVPAALTGIAFAKAYARLHKRTALTGAITGAILGTAIGSATAYFVLGASPNLIHPMALDGFAPFAVPGLFGGAVAGAHSAFLMSGASAE